jgi:hypothetical protein
MERTRNWRGYPMDRKRNKYMPYCHVEVRSDLPRVTRAFRRLIGGKKDLPSSEPILGQF